MRIPVYFTVCIIFRFIILIFILRNGVVWRLRRGHPECNTRWRYNEQNNTTTCEVQKTPWDFPLQRGVIKLEWWVSEYFISMASSLFIPNSPNSGSRHTSTILRHRAALKMILDIYESHRPNAPKTLPPRKSYPSLEVYADTSFKSPVY